jgi:cytoskeleton protein RodZ
MSNSDSPDENTLTSLTHSPISAGAALKAAREKAGLDVQAVSQAIKFSARQIAWLEADDYEKLSGITFTKGVIRSYARFLGIDPLPLLAACDAQVSWPQHALSLPTSDVSHYNVGLSKWRRYRKGLLLLLLVVFVWVLAVLPWNTSFVWLSSNTDAAAVQEGGIGPAASNGHLSLAAAKSVSETASPVPPDTPPVSDISGVRVVAPVTSENALSAPREVVVMRSDAVASASLRRLSFSFHEDAWLEIRHAQTGARIFSKLNHKGSNQAMELHVPLSLVVGNARGVRLWVDGREFDLSPHTLVSVARFNLD